MTDTEIQEIRDMFKDDPQSLNLFEHVLAAMDMKGLPIVARIRAKRACNLLASKMLKRLRQYKDSKHNENHNQEN